MLLVNDNEIIYVNANATRFCVVCDLARMVFGVERGEGNSSFKIFLDYGITWEYVSLFIFFVLSFHGVGLADMCYCVSLLGWCMFSKVLCFFSLICVWRSCLYMLLVSSVIVSMLICCMWNLSRIHAVPFFWSFALNAPCFLSQGVPWCFFIRRI